MDLTLMRERVLHRGREHQAHRPSAGAGRWALGAALSAVGLISYPPEWWHWSYGDRYWAATTAGSHAIYTPR